MKKDFKRPNGTIKRIQVCPAPKAMTTTMDAKIKKGEQIIHLSSSRATGETWVFTREEWAGITATWPTGKWHSPKKWTDQLTKKWKKENPDHPSLS